MEGQDMKLKEAVKLCWQKKFTLKGRSSRQEYWLGSLGIAIIMMVSYVVLFCYAGIMFALGSQLSGGGAGIAFFAAIAPIVVWIIGFIIVYVSMMTRRLHDVGRRGWWILLNIIPFIGSLVILFWLLKPSDGDNQFGTRPEGAGTMTLQTGLQLAYERKFSFSGRSNRSEYWVGIGAIYFISSCIEVISQLLIMVFAEQSWVVILVGIAVIIGIALGLLSIGLTVRRLHDIGKSGWWWFLNFILVIGTIILVIWLIRPSEGDNQYGVRDYTLAQP